MTVRSPRTFRTRLFDMRRELPLSTALGGAGWSIRLRGFSYVEEHPPYCREPDPFAAHHMLNIVSMRVLNDNAVHVCLAPEILIETSTFERAQRAMRMILAGHALVQMDLLDEDMPAFSESGEGNMSGLGATLEIAHAASFATEGIFDGAIAGVTASRRRSWSNALARYYHGFKMSGVHWMDTHPRYGETLAVRGEPLIYVGHSTAITAFYSVIEELGLEVRASRERPSKIGGHWNPPVLADLRHRLAAARINPDDTIPLLLRGTPSRIERNHPPPSGIRAAWSSGQVRDRQVADYDAIAYASTVRSKVSAHRSSARTHSLTRIEVSNVQMLARYLLRGVMKLLP